MVNVWTIGSQTLCCGLCQQVSPLLALRRGIPVDALAVQGDPNELQPQLCGRFEDNFNQFPLKTRYHDKPPFVL
jgi:epoxyqueuosine reductase QueG